MERTVATEITVTVPARPDYVNVLRSVIAGVAARLDLPVDEIDDLRIALDEACSHLLATRTPASTLAMRITPTPETVEVMAWIDADTAPWPPPGAEETLTWQVLSALTDETAFVRTDQGPALRFVKRVAAE